MSENKFKYQRPENTKEHIEAIYEEFRSTPSDKGDERKRTLKDLVSNLLDHAKKIESTKDRDKKSDDYSIQFSLYALAFIAVIFLWNGSGEPSEWEWINTHRFALKLWGIAFASVFIGVSIERSSLFKRLWSFGFTKIVASVAISALLIFSTGKASSLINNVFGIDASAFPLTRTYITGLLAFQYSSPVLIVVVFFAIIHALDIIGYIRSRQDYEFPPLNSIVFLLLATVVLFFSWKWIYHDFTDNEYPTKIYRLAHILDFNSRHSCTNIPQGVSVVFIGSNQSKVLVDTANIQTENIESFVDPKISGRINLPEKYYLLPCI